MQMSMAILDAVPQELKENPGKLKADAKVRISKQSGRSVTDINKVLGRYEVLCCPCVHCPFPSAHTMPAPPCHPPPPHTHTHATLRIRHAQTCMCAHALAASCLLSPPIRPPCSEAPGAEMQQLQSVCATKYLNSLAKRQMTRASGAVMPTMAL